jgi:hypothetical protein
LSVPRSNSSNGKTEALIVDAALQGVEIMR